MRTRRLLTGVAIAVLAGSLAGCGGNDTTDLRQFLADHHKFDNGYDGLGTVTVSDAGDVKIDTKAWADPSYGAYLYCSWAEDWLRGEGHGDADSQIVVVMDGSEVLRSRGESESCQEAG